MANAQNHETLPAFRQLSHQPPYIRRMDRLHPGLEASLPKLRQATFEDWRSFGFDQLEKQGLATVLSDKNGYAIVAETKTATNSSLDVLLVTLPHKGSPITHTVDELPEAVQEDLFTAIEHGVTAIERVAEYNNQRLVRVYMQQHVAAEEQNDYVFKNTFPQTHFHLIGVTEQDLQEADYNPQRPRSLDRQDRYRFNDPTLSLTHDLYQELFGNTEVDTQTASVIVSRRSGDSTPASIPQEERQQLVAIMSAWKTVWKEVSGCFTDFQRDEFERPLPLPQDERTKKVQEFIHRHPSLSPQSQEVLQYLAERLSDFNPQHVLSALYNSIAGSVGWTIDYDNQTTTLRFAPRAFVSPNKVGATDGLYVAIKNRDSYMDETQRQQYLALQRQLIAAIAMEKKSESFPNEEYVENLPTLPFNLNVRIDNQHGVLYKTHRRFSPLDVLKRYDELQQAGIPVGERPAFVISPTHGVVEIDTIINGINGYEYLQHAQDNDCLSFYTKAILGNVKKIIDAQKGSDSLAFSIDAVPQNFIYDPLHNSFIYVDYEPLDARDSHKHLLSPEKLVNYALVKFGREKPALFAQAIAATKEMFAGTPIEQYLEQLPYDKLQALLAQKEFGQVCNVISSITEKDELLGVAIMLTANLEDSRFTSAAPRIRQMFPERLAQQEPNNDRETIGNFLTRTLSRKDTDAYQQALFSLLED